MAFSIRLTEEERALAESYAKLHSYTLAEAFKRALFEKIEDQYDIAIYDAAYKEYEDSGKQSRPIKEFWKELQTWHIRLKWHQDLKENLKKIYKDME